MPTIVYEQAVYGSFPGWNRGYDLLARSPGCRPEWIDGFRATCQQYGEPTRGASAGGLIVRRLTDRVELIVRPSSAGTDDHGRPNALAFHALFVSAADFRRIDRMPFRLGRCLREGWTTATSSLPAMKVDLDGEPFDRQPDHLAVAIATGMTRGIRFAIEREGPIDELAARVWALLRRADRAGKSLATWTLANTGRFDLLATPRLHGLELAPDYVAIELGESDPALVTTRWTSIVAARGPWFFRPFAPRRKIPWPPVEEA